MLLAGDVGGTKTLLGLFERATPRPTPRVVHSYTTLDFTSFAEILDAFARDVRQPFSVSAAALGVAGPVVGDTDTAGSSPRAQLTNVPWEVDTASVTARFATTRVRLLNDLEAMATSIEVLQDAELEPLQAGVPNRGGNAVVIAAGTGLGAAFLHRVNGRLRPVPTENGHADFAARTEREIEIVRLLRDRYGRAEIEQVLSGMGLINLHRLTHGDRPCASVGDRDAPDAPAAVSRAALDGTCASCEEALGLFVEAYGAETGNLALRGVATGGVFVGGGIAPKILPWLRDGRFMHAFGAKQPMTHLLARMPVQVILNPDAGLLGAAVAAQELLS